MRDPAAVLLRLAVLRGGAVREDGMITVVYTRNELEAMSEPHLRNLVFEFVAYDAATVVLATRPAMEALTALILGAQAAALELANRN